MMPAAGELLPVTAADSMNGRSLLQYMLCVVATSNAADSLLMLCRETAESAAGPAGVPDCPQPTETPATATTPEGARAGEG